MSHPTSTDLTHTAIARKYALPIGGTLLLLMAENITMVLVPYLLGETIDGLVNKQHDALWVFLGVSLIGLAVGICRRLYDTRVYGRIYEETVIETVDKASKENMPTSKITARADFIQEFTEFFEHLLPAAFGAVLSLVGATVMLAIISPALSVATVSVALVIGIVFFLSRHYIERLNTGLNNAMERQVDVLESKEAGKARYHFSALVRWRIRLSDLEARNFGVAFFFALLLITAAVYILVAVEGKSAGQAFAGLTYVLQFTEAVIILPYTYQEFLRTREIGSRISDT